jgi:hypothetical protein
MKPPSVMLIGKYPSHGATRASAALYCAGARIVSASPDLAILVEPKPAARPMRLGVPLIAIVPRASKRKALAAGADAAYTEPVNWKAYSRLVERVLVEWTGPRKGRVGAAIRRDSPPRRARSR